MDYTRYKTLIWTIYKFSLLTSGIKEIIASLQILEEPKINVTEGNNNVGSIVLEETTQELQNVVVQGKIVHVRTQPDGFSVDVKDIRDANKQLQPL